MLERFYQWMINDEMDIKERLFRVILISGTIAVGLAIIQGLTLVNAENLMLIYGIMFVAFTVAIVLTFKFHNTELSSTILGITIIVIALPFVFLKGGGVNSGAGLWLCLGIFYVFIMFSGIKLAIFLALTVMIDIGCYVVAYLYPEKVVELATKFETHFDSLFAVLIVGLTVGIVMKFQLKVFNQERQKNLIQQEELEAMGKAKDSFFASMSHEIRTPINSVIGLNELILRENPSEKVQDYAKNIKSASKMLLSLVNDILDLSQLEIKKMQLVDKEYKTEEMLRDVVDMMQVPATEKDLEFILDIDDKIPSVLMGDERRIKQILINILSNAVKYTETGSITFSCSLEEADEKQASLKFSIADTGVGIRKEELEFLFDAFRRVDNQKNYKIEGTGLGLSITKQLLDLMGGNITVDSIYTQGSVFTVNITQKIVNSAPMGALMLTKKNKSEGIYYSKSFEAPEARVLIVDDDDLNLIITTKLLQDTKMSIDTASSADECLRKTKKRYYNLILMDYMMPDMDGGQLLKELRKQENGLCRDTAVVLLSANIYGDKHLEYLQMGFDGLLEKPIDATRLEEEALKHIPNELIEYRRDGGANGEIFTSGITKKRKKVYVTSDGVCDIPEELLDKYDIKLIDLYVKTEFGRFRDSKEIDANNLKRYLSSASSEAYSLSPVVEDYERFFAETLIEADDVIYISMAKATGHCYENAMQAAQCFDHVHVVDSGQISCGQGLVVLYAAKLAAEGVTLQNILKEIDNVKNKIRSSFVLPGTTIFYQKGFTDRITWLICEFFKMRPVLGSSNSKIGVRGVRLGKLENVWRGFIRFHLRNASRIDDDVIFVVHAGCSVRQQELIMEEINRNMKFKKIIFAPASSASVCNAGLKSIGFAVYSK